MKKNEIYSYVYDFVSRLIEKVGEDVKDIIVFGSVVRGNFDEESDVDIFINTKNEAKVSDIVKTCLNEFYSHSRHTWVVRGIENQINPIVGDLDSNKWSNLKREIISNSLVIYGNYKELPKETKHSVLITYNLSKLKPKNKSKFIRDLSGYRLVQNKKEYKIKGLLDEVGGTKVSRNAILVPKEYQERIYNFFSKSKSTFEIREVWVKG